MDIYKIATYDDVAELIESECPEYVNNIEPDVMDYLSSVNDFECFAFMVINNDLVVIYDRLSGDVVNRLGIVDFIDQSVDEAREEIFEND